MEEEKFVSNTKIKLLSLFFLCKAYISNIHSTFIFNKHVCTMKFFFSFFCVHQSRASARKIRVFLRRGGCRPSGIHGEFLDTRVFFCIQLPTSMQKKRAFDRRNYGETTKFVNVPKYNLQRVVKTLLLDASMTTFFCNNMCFRVVNTKICNFLNIQGQLKSSWTYVKPQFHES